MNNFSIKEILFLAIVLIAFIFTFKIILDVVYFVFKHVVLFMVNNNLFFS